MSKNLINKYIWLVDTIMRHKSITRSELNVLWVKNESLSDGNPLPRRTFYNYCRAIEDTFDINIACNSSTYEYYIENAEESESSLHDWLLDSVSISGTLADSREVASRIVLENVPSARTHLPVILDGVKSNRKLRIKYCAFDRTMTSEIILEPYFVRIFRQRWYVIGFENQYNSIRTYALDRISEVQLTSETFEGPEVSAEEFYKYSFGIFTDKGTPHNIKLKVSSSQAKYFRALPLHHSQQEEIHDRYSIFSYQMLVTFDLIQEILHYGKEIEVLAPKTLRMRVADELEKALAAYK